MVKHTNKLARRMGKKMRRVAGEESFDSSVEAREVPDAAVPEPIPSSHQMTKRERLVKRSVVALAGKKKQKRAGNLDDQHTHSSRNDDGTAHNKMKKNKKGDRKQAIVESFAKQETKKQQREQQQQQQHKISGGLLNATRQHATLLQEVKQMQAVTNSSHFQKDPLSAIGEHLATTMPRLQLYNDDYSRPPTTTDHSGDSVTQQKSNKKKRNVGNS